MTDRDIFLIEVARRGRDSAPAPPDYATMRGDIDELKTRPAIRSITDIPDVSGTPSDGDILIWNDASDAWELRPPAPPITVEDTGSVDLTMSGSTLKADVRFAGTGTSSRAARADHEHTTPRLLRESINPGGYMSSGERPLASTNWPLDANIVYVVEAELRIQMRGGDPGPCYYRLALTIDDSTRRSPGGTGGFWCVQGVPQPTTWTYARTFRGTGQAVTISAAVSHYDGGGFNTDYGELIVWLRPVW